MLQTYHDPPTIAPMEKRKTAKVLRDVQTSIRLSEQGKAELARLMQHYRASMGGVIERLIQERHAEVFPAPPSPAPRKRAH